MQAALSRRAFAPRVYRRNLTCEKTVMSARAKFGFADFIALSSEIDRVRCALVQSFLVRNWCGSAATEAWTGCMPRLAPFGFLSDLPNS